MTKNRKQLEQVSLDQMDEVIGGTHICDPRDPNCQHMKRMAAAQGGAANAVAFRNGRRVRVQGVPGKDYA